MISMHAFALEDTRSLSYKTMTSEELYSRADSTDTLAVDELIRRQDKGALPLLLRVRARVTDRQNFLTEKRKSLPPQTSPKKPFRNMADYMEAKELADDRTAISRLRIACGILGDPATLAEYERDLQSSDGNRVISAIGILAATNDQKYVKKISLLLDSKVSIDHLGVAVYAMNALKQLLPNVSATLLPKKVISQQEELDLWKGWRDQHINEFK